MKFRAIVAAAVLAAAAFVPAARAGGKPEQVVFAAGDNSAVSLDVRLGSFPDIFKQIALGQLDNQLQNAKDQKIDNETPAMKEFRLKMLELIGERMKMILTDGEALSLK